MDKELRIITVDHMKKTIDHLHHELSVIRTGRASTALLDGIKIDYFGTPSPLKHVATVSVPEPKVIVVQPFQANMLAEIEKAIMKSDLGLTPNSDGHVIRLPIPALTEDRRKDIIKIVRHHGEETKVAIRNVRRDVIEKLRALEKTHELPEDDRRRGEKEAQDLTDKYISEIDKIIEAKEKEVMTV